MYINSIVIYPRAFFNNVVYENTLKAIKNHTLNVIFDNTSIRTRYIIITQHSQINHKTMKQRCVVVFITARFKMAILGH